VQVPFQPRSPRRLAPKLHAVWVSDDASGFRSELAADYPLTVAGPTINTTSLGAETVAVEEPEDVLGAPAAESTDARPRLDLLRLAVIGMLACYVWRVQELFSVLTAVKASLVVSVLAITLFATSSSAVRNLSCNRHGVTKLSALLIGWMIITIPTSLYPGKSLSFITDDHVKTFFLLLLVVGSVRAFVDVERYAVAQVLGGMLYCWVVLTRFSVGAGGRLGNLIYYDANDLAMMLVGALPLTVYFMRRGTPIVGRLVAALAACAYLVSIVQSGSRGGLLGLIAVAAYVLVGYSSIPARIRIGAIAGGLLILSVFGSDWYWAQMGTILNPQDDYNWAGKDEMGRMEVWKRGIGYMMDRPITGVGVSAFPVAEGTISPLAQRQEFGHGTKWSAAHNSFVQVGAELGIPGLVAFIALLIVAFRSLGRIIRPRPRDPPDKSPQAAMAQALRGSLIGYAVSGFFLSQAYAVFLYSMLGLVVALCAVCREQTGDPLEGAVGG
jgi:O-antigen ligase